MPPQEKPAVLILLGRRRGALKAARRLGASMLLLDESPLSRVKDAQHQQVDFSQPQHYWQELARRLGLPADRCALVALAERTVFPAACLRQALGLPGTGPETALLCRDKARMKERVRQAGIPCARFATDEDRLDGREIAQQLGLPLVLKPRDSSGGRGMRIVRRLDEVPPAIPPGWMAESFVEGVEMSLESLIVQGRPIFTNPTEYWRPRWANIVPAFLEQPLHKRVEAFNLRVIEVLGIENGLTHLEIFVQQDRILFGEIALRPPGGYLMDLMEIVYGYDPWQALLELELDPLQPPNILPPVPTPSCFAGVLLFHPGAGLVRSIEGAEQASFLPQTRLHLKVRPGDQLSERQGSGQEAGHVIAVGKYRQEVIHRLEKAEQLLRIQVG